MSSEIARRRVLRPSYHFTDVRIKIRNVSGFEGVHRAVEAPLNTVKFLFKNYLCASFKLVSTFAKQMILFMCAIFMYNLKKMVKLDSTKETTGCKGEC